jgi:hypothetical protein
MSTRSKRKQWQWDGYQTVVHLKGGEVEEFHDSPGRSLDDGRHAAIQVNKDGDLEVEVRFHDNYDRPVVCVFNRESWVRFYRYPVSKLMSTDKEGNYHGI